MTTGEKIVRVQFNPSNDSTVHQLKTKYAELINIVEKLKEKDPERVSTAIIQLEASAMFAVKAATADL